MSPSKRTKALIAASLFLLWIVSTAYAFWWFEFKNLRSFDTNAAGTVIKPDMHKLYTQLMEKLPTNRHGVVVVHFWNPGCYCNRFNLVHLQQIMREYRARKINFYVAVDRSNIDSALRAEAKTRFGDLPILALDKQTIKALVPSAPSAAVLLPGKGITYFGPYSQGAMCSSQNGSFVEKVLDASLAGNISAQSNTLAFGCYCDW